jgi:hypothetical protein
MKRLLIVALIFIAGCIGPAHRADDRIISVTSKENILSGNYGPYFSDYQNQNVNSILKRYSEGILREEYLEEQRVDHIYYKKLEEQKKHKHTDNYFYLERNYYGEHCMIWLIPPFLDMFCAPIPDMYMLLEFNYDNSCYAIISSEENDEDELKSTADLNFIKKKVSKEKHGMTMEIAIEDGELCPTRN